MVIASVDNGFFGVGGLRNSGNSHMFGNTIIQYRLERSGVLGEMRTHTAADDQMIWFEERNNNL